MEAKATGVFNDYQRAQTTKDTKGKNSRQRMKEMQVRVSEYREAGPSHSASINEADEYEQAGYDREDDDYGHRYSINNK